MDKSPSPQPRVAEQTYLVHSRGCPAIFVVHIAQILSFVARLQTGMANARWNSECISEIATGVGDGKKVGMTSVHLFVARYIRRGSNP